MNIRPRRSVLYMPGSNARVLEKAKTLTADAIIMDLEDAVAPDAKLRAREQVCAALKAGGYGKREIIIRINALSTPWGRDDLNAALDARPDAILVPKIETAGDVENLSQIMNQSGADPSIGLWVMMETPLAIINAASIGAAAGQSGARLGAFVMGTNDLIKDTRTQMTPDRLAALHWLSTCQIAARAYGIDIIDGVYNNFKDEQGFRIECAQGRTLGMDGKTLIHPGQIEICNDVFSPGQEDIALARKIIAAFADPANQGQGVLTVDGRMVELLHAQMAERTVAIADAITELGTSCDE